MIVFAAVNVDGARRLRRRPLDHARHHLLGVQARLQRRRLLRRRPRHHRLPERPRDLRRLPVGCVVPRHRGPDLPLRLRRLRLLDRLPRRVPDGDVPARRADAELGQVHDRRRAVLPPARAPRARRRRRIGTLNVAAFYLIAQMVGAGVLIQALVGIDFTPAVLITGTFMLVYVVFGGMVATTWVQIIKAVLLMIGIVVMSIFVLAQDQLQPDRAVQPGRGGRQGRGLDVLARPGHVPQEQHRHGLARPRARARHGRAAAHPDAVLHRAGRQGRALVGRLRDVHDRLLLPADDGHRVRRARHPRAGGRRGRRHRRQPGGAEPRRGARRRTRAPRAATCSWPSSPASRSRRSSRWSPASCCRRRARWRTTSGRASSARARTPRRRRSLVAKIAALGDRRGRDADRDPRRRGPERLVHGRPRVRHRGERELPRPAARAQLAALQHGRRRHRRAVRRRLRARPDHHQPDRVGRPARRARHRRVRRGTTSTTPASSRSRWASSAATSVRCCRRSAGNERTFHELHVRSETGLGVGEGAGRGLTRKRRAGHHG